MSDYTLAKGPHPSPNDGMCSMEWVAYLAGEPHSDKPVCVSPMLTSFCITLNDSLPDEQRQRMRPYLARTIGTRGDGLDEGRRWLCADWLVREYTPAFLALVPSLAGHAEALRALPAVLSAESVERAMGDLNHARGDATAARDAARDAAWDAAAGVAARDAAGDAGGAAAWAAARAAAWDAGGDALAPTVTALQDSILAPGGLLDRMLPLEPLTVPVVGEWRQVCAFAG